MKLEIIKNRFSNLNKYIYLILSSLSLFFLIYLANIFGIQKLINKLENYEELIPIVIVLLRMISSLVPILPGSSYAIIAGGLLGLRQGFIIIFFTDILTCTFCFLISRKFGNFVIERLLPEKFIKKVKSIKFINSKKDILICTLTLMTGFHDFFSYAFGIINIPFRIFFISITLASFITVPILIMIGSGIFSENKITYFFISIFILLIINSRKTIYQQIKNFL